MYKKVKLGEKGFVGVEEEVAKNWKKNDIIKKNFDMNKGKRIALFIVIVLFTAMFDPAFAFLISSREVTSVSFTTFQASLP